MGIIACKFGGTSTAGADCFRQIRRILDMDPRRRYVVLSAPGAMGDAPKVTDLLYQGEIERAAARFAAIGESLGIPAAGDRALCVLKEARRVSTACLVSRGEMLCAALFSEYAGMPFVDAAEVIRFERTGRVDVPETLLRIRIMSMKNCRAVLPGFYGADADGNVVLFPRNGSDITGALVAAGVGAMLYENWTDVPGLMTADPAMDPDAAVIPKITYADMRKMAETSAQVLHPDSLSPVENAGIPTRIRCTFRPEMPGTLVKN